MSSAKESKKKTYTKPVLISYGQGPKARDKIIDWAVNKGISGTELDRLLQKLRSR